MISKTDLFVIIGILLILMIVVIIWQRIAYKVAEPKYVVLKSDQSIEIRKYPCLIIAQTSLNGGRYTAINAGFRLLADYIFGNNQIKQKIAMTAPVMQEGANIPMVVPDTQQMSGDRWIVRFVMPSDFTITKIPKPNNPAVTLLTIPSKTYAVIRFSGSNTDDNLQTHLEALIIYNNKNHLTTVGNPIMAFYNPPWILPFLRRNEVMLELKQ
jgi:effector-binding domain-containing protein